MFLIYKNHLTKIFKSEIFKFTYFRFTIDYSELLYNVVRKFFNIFLLYKYKIHTIYYLYLKFNFFK